MKKIFGALLALAFSASLAFAQTLGPTPSSSGGSSGITGGTTTVTSCSNTQVLFNDAGTVGCDAGLTYNKTTDTLTAAGGLQAGTTLGISTDVLLNRDAANTLAQRNGTAAQTGRTYNTFTDASNGEWFDVDWATTANVATIGTNKNGTGAVRNLKINVGGVNKLDFGVTRGGTWSTPSGIGIWADGGVTISTSNTFANANGSYLFPSATTGALTGTLRIVASGGTSAINFGGDTSSFPSIKRSGTNLIVTGGDDTAVGGLTVNGPVGGMGYSTGAGGTVTQATSRSTGVTLNKVTGQITTTADSLAAIAIVTFTVTNSAVAATDTIILSKVSGDIDTSAWVSAVAAGSFNISLRNNDAVSADTTAFVVNFAVIKGVTS